MNKWVAVIFILLATVVVVFNLNCKGKPKEDKQTATDLLYLNHHDTVSYVGKETCRACHSDKYNTFIHTGMGMSFDKASKQKSAAEYNHKPVYDKYRDFYYKPYWSDGSLYFLEYRLEGRDTVHRRLEKIDYIIGSGQHTNSHIIETNGYLNQAPLTWYAQQGRWDLPPGFEDGHNTRFSRLIGLECMSCHNAIPGYEKESENRFTFIPNGIDCERCHGPGELHVKEKSAGRLVDTAKTIDYTIVNPGKLPWERQIDVCQRCHLQGNAVLKDGKTFTDFRPGMRLSDVFDVFMPRYEGNDEQFIMASHAERLQKSPCFIQSNKNTGGNAKMKFTCITCHDPHISVTVTGKQVFNNACISCHTQQGCTEEKAIRMKVGDNCTQCHMPKSGTIDIPHVTVHDHYIRKPVDKTDAQSIRKFIGLYAVNEANPDNLTKGRAYLNYYEKFDGKDISLLDSAYYYLTKADNPRKELIHWAYLKNNYVQVANYATQLPKDFAMDAWTAYRIGQSYYSMGNAAKAEGYLQQANALAPANIEFKARLAAVKIELNKIAGAKPILTELLKDYPQHPQSLTNLGYVYFLEGDIAKANEYYDKALSYDPDYEAALMNKAGVYNYLKDYEKARKMLQRILKRNPNNQQAKQVLEQLKGL